MKRFGLALVKRLTYANVVATLALFLALGGTAAAAVLITSNSQVAANTISGHVPPAGKHANLIGGSVNGVDLAPVTKAALELHCRAGLQLGGNLCFDRSPRTAATWKTALATCALANLRLPSVGELSLIFNSTAASQASQWTDEVYFDGTSFQASMVSQSSSRVIEIATTSLAGMASFRCVTTPAN